MADDSKASYVGWEEAVVSSDKGRREVRYYLKRRGGGRDLVVVGKEKSSRHISYRYTIKGNKLLGTILEGCSKLKLRSRRDVVDWLNLILSGKLPTESLEQFEGGVEGKLDVDAFKMQNQREYGKGFAWLGSPWLCRKRRRHYQAFSRNGAVISSQDFVYVLAEEGKRLVAYIDDLYEDNRGNKMVVVRWFHKIDEVGFILPHFYNDREIFISLCLQDLSIECIDGLATVLSPEHYEKFSAEATGLGLVPFVCCRQFDNHDVKPFDITRLKGYWKQQILGNSFPSWKLSEVQLRSKVSLDDAIEFRPNKRIRWSKESDLNMKSPDKRVTIDDTPVCKGNLLDVKGGGVAEVGSRKGCSQSLRSRDSSTPSKSQEYLSVGSHVEVLSQDSGIRGCWFRASIVKKHKDKVKVEYQDVKDALDESKNLEEWIMASRIAAPDTFGTRLPGRTTVRPTLLSEENRVFCTINVGSIIDARWHDGWWEGIVVKKESEDRFDVYFPGERLHYVFNTCDLRHSKEWLNNEWHDLKERPDLALELSGVKKISDIAKASDHTDLATPNSEVLPQKKTSNETGTVRDLSKDHSLTQLRWKSSGKRRGSRSPVHRAHFSTSRRNSPQTFQTFEKFFNPSLKFDSDNCKYGGDTHFTSSVVPTMTSLVMSR